MPSSLAVGYDEPQRYSPVRQRSADDASPAHGASRYSWSVGRPVVAVAGMTLLVLLIASQSTSFAPALGQQLARLVRLNHEETVEQEKAAEKLQQLRGVVAQLRTAVADLGNEVEELNTGLNQCGYMTCAEGGLCCHDSICCGPRDECCGSICCSGTDTCCGGQICCNQQDICCPGKTPVCIMPGMDCPSPIIAPYPFGTTTPCPDDYELVDSEVDSTKSPKATTPCSTKKPTTPRPTTAAEDETPE